GQQGLQVVVATEGAEAVEAGHQCPDPGGLTAAFGENAGHAGDTGQLQQRPLAPPGQRGRRVVHRRITPRVSANRSPSLMSRCRVSAMKWSVSTTSTASTPGSLATFRR